MYKKELKENDVADGKRRDNAGLSKERLSGDEHCSREQRANIWTTKIHHASLIQVMAGITAGPPTSGLFERHRSCATGVVNRIRVGAVRNHCFARVKIVLN